MFNALYVAILTFLIAAFLLPVLHKIIAKKQRKRDLDPQARKPYRQSRFTGWRKYTFPDGRVLSVSEYCIRTYPCKHKIKWDHGDPQLKNALELSSLFQQHKMHVPEHFESWASRGSNGKIY